MVLSTHIQHDSQWAFQMCFERKFAFFLAEVENGFLTARLFTTLTELTRLLTRKNTFKKVTHFSSMWITYSPVMIINILLYVWQRYVLSNDLAVWGVGLRPNACWDCGFESRRQHVYLSFVSVVCCQVEVCASAGHSSRGILQSVVCLSVIMNPWQWVGLDLLGAVVPW